MSVAFRCIKSGILYHLRRYTIPSSSQYVSVMVSLYLDVSTLKRWASFLPGCICFIVDLFRTSPKVIVPYRGKLWHDANETVIQPAVYCTVRVSIETICIKCYFGSRLGGGKPNFGLGRFFQASAAFVAARCNEQIITYSYRCFRKNDTFSCLNRRPSTSCASIALVSVSSKHHFG